MGDKNSITVLVNDVEELVSIELSEATQELEKATLAIENAETSKARLDASMNLKKETARLEAVNYVKSKDMVTNSDFNFTKNETVTLELPFSEHIEELRQRIFHIFWVILILSCLAFFEVKFLVKILELPVDNVKFFQLSPGEYFVSTVKIAFYAGLLFGSPFAIGQLILFLVPGLTKKETKIVLPLLLGSLCLF